MKASLFGCPITNRLIRRRDTKLHSAVLSLRSDIMGGQKDSTTTLNKTTKTNATLLEGLSNAQRDGLGVQTSINTAVENLNSRTFNFHAETTAQLTQMQSLLSELRFDQERMQTDAWIQASSKSALIPIIRVELKRIVLPPMEQSLRDNKTHFDSQMDRTRQAIDKMTQSLGHMLNDEPTSDGHSWTRVPAQTRVQSVRHEEDLCPRPGLDEFEVQLSDNFWPSKDCLGDQASFWSRTWTYRWSIGFFCVKISRSRTRSKGGATSQAFGPSTSAWSEEVYHLSITFQPVHRMLSEGIFLMAGSRSDQHGYYLMCPEISTFAIVPDDSRVLKLARNGDIQGLKKLLAAKLGSPTDRDRRGRTPLHVGRHIYLVFTPSISSLT